MRFVKRVLSLFLSEVSWPLPLALQNDTNAMP